MQGEEPGEGAQAAVAGPGPTPSPRPGNGRGPAPEPPPARPDAADGPEAEATTKRNRFSRRSRRTITAGALLMLALIGLAYYLHSRHFESTDDAQVDAHISNIGARVSGTVTAVRVDQNQVVNAGDVLVEIDPTDLEVALAQAKAAVAQATAQLAAEDPSVMITMASNAAELTNASSNIASGNAGLIAAEKDVDQSTARLAEAQANQRNAALERTRGEQLFAQQAIPRAELDRRETAAAAADAVVEGARHSVAAAHQRVEQQRAQLDAIRSRLTEVRKTAPRQLESRRALVLFRQANLEAAKAQERQAELNLSYTRVRAPVAGIVARRGVNVGDHVAPGQQLIALAQTGNVWVTANFRETQLKRMRPGQTVSIQVDALGSSFSGRVESLGGATGSRLSVLPPENATGNFVKVVQRIPVRILFDGGQPGLERLRAGMSVEPRVRVVP